MNKTVNINLNKIYTKSAYSKEVGMNRVRLDKEIKEGNIKSLRVKGTVLVIAK